MFCTVLLQVALSTGHTRMANHGNNPKLKAPPRHLQRPYGEALLHRPTYTSKEDISYGKHLGVASSSSGTHLAKWSAMVAIFKAVSGASS
jgi:hypothetical protein